MNNLLSSVIDNFAAIAATLFMAALVAYLAWRNNRAVRVAAAGAAFRAAFNDAHMRLIASREATSTIILRNHNGHLAAIFAFRPYVVWWRRHSFDRAAKNYSLKANIQSAKGPIEALLFDATDEARAQRAALLSAIEKLLSHASAT